MKINKAVTETLINFIHIIFEKDLGLGEFENFLVESDIPEKETKKFLCKDKIDYLMLDKRMKSDSSFFLKLATNLLSHLGKEQRELFQGVMKKFGYILGVNKQFRKGTKPELQDFSGSKVIRKIEIYKDEKMHRFKIAVNGSLLDGWTKPTGNTDKHYWDYLYEIATTGKSEIFDIAKSTGIIQWFNSNEKENPIYKSTGLKKTSIIERRGEFFYSAPGVDIKKLSERKAYLKSVR